MKETAFEIAQLAATIAGPKRAPHAYIEAARALLRACQEPTIAPVETPRRVSLELALEVALKDINPSRRRGKLKKLLQADAAKMRVTCGDEPDSNADLRNAQAILDEYERDGIPAPLVEKLMKPKPEPDPKPKRKK